MTTFNIKRFKEIDTKELERKLEVIEQTIKPTQFTISNDDVNFVVDTLEINILDTLEDLTNLRNAIVVRYQKIISDIRNLGGRYEDYDKYITLTSSITHCIDLRLSDLGLMY